jgi:transposase
MGKMNLTDAEREQLISAARSRTVRAADARRAKLILMLEDGESRDSIMSRLECDSRFISRWSRRFLSDRLAGMYARHPGREPKQPPEKLEARVLGYTLKRKPADGSTHWSSYKLAAELGDVSVTAVQRIWRKHGVRPQRLERHMVSNDPDFETKAADVIGLYLNPPAHAVVFCVDEKTAIQALDRKDRMLPLSPGRAESHGFEYKRNGTLSLFAALNTATGEVLGRTAPRHTSEQFVAFLTDIVASQPSGRRSTSSATTSAATRLSGSRTSWPSIATCRCTSPQRTRRG